MWRSTPRSNKGFEKPTKRQQDYNRRQFNSTFASKLFYNLATRFFKENYA